MACPILKIGPCLLMLMKTLAMTSAIGEAMGMFSRLKNLDADGKKAVFKALAAKLIVHVLGTRNVVLLLDDAQWIDPASIEIISCVVEMCKNVLSLCELLAFYGCLLASFSRRQQI
ncbi:hypothetical protein BC829DRAFT_420097 [Chytridium lagenaria]|nr:hypothetical protein BC829DRAFT_420097 [Chytridium lagenaria]